MKNTEKTVSIIKANESIIYTLELKCLTIITKKQTKKTLSAAAKNKQCTNLIYYQLLTESEISIIINWMRYNENKITNWTIKVHVWLFFAKNTTTVRAGISINHTGNKPAGCHLQLGMWITAARQILTVAATLMLYCWLSRSVKTLPVGRVTHKAVSVLLMNDAILLAAVVAASNTNAAK